GNFHHQLCRDEVSVEERPVEPARRRQGAHGHQPRGDESLYAGSRGEAGPLERVETRIRVRHRPACCELPAVRADAPDADRAHAGRLPGGPGGPDGEPVAEAWTPSPLEQSNKQGGVMIRAIALLLLTLANALAAGKYFVYVGTYTRGGASKGIYQFQF